MQKQVEECRRISLSCYSEIQRIDMSLFEAQLRRERLTETIVQQKQKLAEIKTKLSPLFTRLANLYKKFGMNIAKKA